MRRSVSRIRCEGPVIRDPFASDQVFSVGLKAHRGYPFLRFIFQARLNAPGSGCLWIKQSTDKAVTAPIQGQRIETFCQKTRQRGMCRRSLLNQITRISQVL